MIQRILNTWIFGRQVDPRRSRREAEDRDRRVQVDAGRERKPQRPSELPAVHDSSLVRRVVAGGAEREQRLDPRRARSSIEAIAIVNGQAGRVNRFAESDRDPHGHTIQLPRRMAARPPLMATGRIGACAWIAMMNPPFLNGSRASVRLRVPSGKIRNEFPAEWTPLHDGWRPWPPRGSERSIGTKPPTSNV